MRILIGLLILLAVSVGFAQDSQPGPISDFIQDVLLPAVLTLAGAAVTYLVGMVATWLRNAAANQKNELVKRVLDIVATTAATAVGNVAQTAVQELKAAHADGRLTAEEAKAALQTAVGQVWAAIGQAAKDVLLAAVGGNTQKAIETFIVPAVEKEVALLDAALPAAEPITDPDQKARTLALARSRLGLQ